MFSVMIPPQIIITLCLLGYEQFIYHQFIIHLYFEDVQIMIKYSMMGWCPILYALHSSQIKQDTHGSNLMKLSWLPRYFT